MVQMTFRLDHWETRAVITTYISSSHWRSRSQCFRIINNVTRQISVSEMMTGRPGETTVSPVGIVTKGRVPTCQHPHPMLPWFAATYSADSPSPAELLLLKTDLFGCIVEHLAGSNWEHVYLACINPWSLFLVPDTSGMVVHAHNPSRRVKITPSKKQVQKGGELIMDIV